MPRVHPLPKRDREIAARIRKFRRESKCSREYLAVRSGIKGGVITRIELGRIPLKYDVARAIFSALAINPLWAATGEGPEIAKIDLPSSGNLKLPINALFSDVFFRELLPMFKAHVPDKESEILMRYQRGEVNSRAVKLWFSHFTPDGYVAELNKRLAEFWGELLKTFPQDDPKRKLQRDIWYKEYEESIKAKTFAEAELALTVNSLKRNSGSEVKTEIQKLIERVNRKASMPGAKAKLARALGVAPARVSEWLSGEKEPGGNYTLILQKWVNGEL